MVEISEKLLLEAGGWQIWKEAKSLAGAVKDPVYEPPILRGTVLVQGRPAVAGLKILSKSVMQNLCPCRDSRQRGVICAHAIAVGLAYLGLAGKTKRDRADRYPERPAPQQPMPKEPTDEEPEVRLQIEGSLTYIEATLDFRYSRPGLQNTAFEEAAAADLRGFRHQEGKWVLSGQENVLRFYAGNLPRLQQKWKTQIGSRFSKVSENLVRVEPRFRLESSGEDWLALRGHFAAGKAILPQAEVMRLLRMGAASAPIGGGKTAVWEADLLEDFEEVLKDCQPQAQGGGWKVPQRFRDYLEASIQTWERRAPSEQPPVSVLKELPDGFAAALRDYQQKGLVWFSQLITRRAGGILADDMGLGKTLQALAAIRVAHCQALVVCPSSLVFNWMREAERWVPDRKAMRLDGPRRRESFEEAAGSADILITSYALLQRDLDFYKSLRPGIVILDEAQHVKNPDTKNAKAAAAIQANARFVLTGTPIENSLRDLWSLMDFCQPGYLGPYEGFRERYEIPIREGGAQPAKERLRRRIGPFLLRRTKADVLTELPDKLEQVVEVELTDEQATVYESLRRSAENALGEALDAPGARMRMLTAILRLRQVCCDLRLVGREPASTSAKVQAFLETLHEAIDGGHKVLVFSQFAEMLKLLRGELGEMPSCYIDGQTRSREKEVDRFQSDPDVPVFLISLKAGGFGLNLTAADTVIHFDPWWNPAAEAQATDRAHRIGQKSVVTSLKLIAKGTLEERILRLQEKKRALFSDLLDGASASGASLEELRELLVPA